MSEDDPLVDVVGRLLLEESDWHGIDWQDEALPREMFRAQARAILTAIRAHDAASTKGIDSPTTSS
jgi:hypothetical protein